MGDGILGTGVKVVFSMGHAGQALAIIGHARNVDKAADVAAAVTDKYANAQLLSAQVFFLRVMD